MLTLSYRYSKIDCAFIAVFIFLELYTADIPPIMPFKSDRDAQAVAQLIEQNYDDIVSRADSLTECDRYIKVLLGRYAQNEKDESSHFKQLVMLEDEKTIGFIDFVFDPPLTRFGVPSGRILALAVDQSYRGRSYGAHLCNHACSILEDRGAHKIGLMTTSDEVWKKFYAHLGFKRNAIDSAGKFNPTYFYHKQIVAPRSWATIARLVISCIKK